MHYFFISFKLAGEDFPWTKYLLKFIVRLLADKLEMGYDGSRSRSSNLHAHSFFPLNILNELIYICIYLCFCLFFHWCPFIYFIFFYFVLISFYGSSHLTFNNFFFLFVCASVYASIFHASISCSKPTSLCGTVSRSIIQVQTHR